MLVFRGVREKSVGVGQSLFETFGPGYHGDGSKIRDTLPAGSPRVWFAAFNRMDPPVRLVSLRQTLARSDQARREAARRAPAGLRAAAADRGVSNETRARASSSTARAMTFRQRAGVRNRPIERGERNVRTLDREHAAVLAFDRPDRPFVDDRDRAALGV